MRYSRGRIIALAILSVTMAFALFCVGYVFVDWRSSSSHAAGDEVSDLNSVPGFDELYQRIPFADTDTGSVLLGADTQLTLTEERYDRGVLTNLLNSSDKQSFPEWQSKRRYEGYPYPIYSNDDMNKIVNGLGHTLEIPVILLDTSKYDDIVLFELTNLVSTPTEMSITRDGESLSENFVSVSSSLSSDFVYGGLERETLTPKGPNVIEDKNGNALLNVYLIPDGTADEKFVVEIRDLNNNFLYVDQGDDQFKQLEKVSVGETALYNSAYQHVYDVVRESNKVSVYDAQGTLLETVVYDDSAVNRLVSYEIGAVAYNGNALRAMFQKQGFYQISFKQKVAMEDGAEAVELSLAFDFVIVNKANYEQFPRFNLDHRVKGNAEIYNYSYENEYPIVEYSSMYFDVEIQTAVEYGERGEKTRELSFYNIGEYKMVSKLQYYNQYLMSRDSQFNKRGVSQGFLKLKRYQEYESILNIYGFQAYYGGQHSNSKFDGPLPFFDVQYGNASSDISKYVRDMNMTADKTSIDYTTMRVSEALAYADQLAEFISIQGLKPVRTNFPPVKIIGNVLHATGTGINGEKAEVLSTVSYKAAYGLEDAGKWKSSTLQVGEPFEAAGQYLVTVYFKVNKTICQQNFFFEISNSAKIAFEVTDNSGTSKLYYAGDLTLAGRDISGKNIKISYDGDTTLGQFEVPPTITLESAKYGSYNNYTDMHIQMEDDGSFEFTLAPRQYRLTVKYGAHNKSVSVYHIVVDDTQATGINVNKQSLAGLPSDMAVVGAGSVQLTWDHKPSGLNFTDVTCKFYEMQVENNDNVDPNGDRNYFEISEPNLNKTANLYSAYSFVEESSYSGYAPVKTETGWTLNESFNLPGLYLFTIIDEVGNETEYILIIDDSLPTFVQSGIKNDTSNVVDFDEEGVYVCFGARKLIPGNYATFQPIEKKLVDAGILIDDTRKVQNNQDWIQSAIVISLSKVEYSNSGEQYQEVTEDEFEQGYVVLKEEGTFYFRVTDKLGNTGEYYIVLTHDNCFGTVYADKNRPTFSDVDKRLIANDVSIDTSLVNNKGGMTNRSYVSFSFQQRDAEENFCVNEIYLQYYPFTYDQTSTNYPFADTPLKSEDSIFAKYYDNEDSNNGDDDELNIINGLIYKYNENDASKTIRLGLFDTKNVTPAGMYVITRQYRNTPSNSIDPAVRDYYFIVDDQKMLYYAEGKYQTQLKVKFANNQDDRNAKVANAKIIENNDKQLSSDRTAWVIGFDSKYSYYYKFGTEYTLNFQNTYFVAGYKDSTSNGKFKFDFPSLMPRFSYIHNYQTYDLFSGSGIDNIGDSVSANDSNIYKLLIRDDARNISCKLKNGGLTELFDHDDNAPTSANYDFLTLNLELGKGTKAEIQISEDKVISNSHMQYDNSDKRYYYIVDPNDIEDLKFSFKSDPKSMYANIDVNASVATWETVGFDTSYKPQIPVPVNSQYTFDLMGDYLNDYLIENGASLSVSLIAEDDSITNYTILFDVDRPNYNLNRVHQTDNLACLYSRAELPSSYIYGLSNDFAFTVGQENYYLETKKITYREVDYSGVGTQTAVPFKIHNEANGEEIISFAELVGLRDNEMKYYVITETDYAGHTTSYTVQVQGENYDNKIDFIGAITDEKDNQNKNIQIGCEMRVSKSSVHEFFISNNSFKFESGSDYYTVLGKVATWQIGDDVGSGDKNEENLINILNDWINLATENGSKFSYTLYDRIGDVEYNEFYNIRESSTQIQLDCNQASNGSNIILVSVTNHDDLPKILFDDNLSSLFKMSIKDVTTNDAPTVVSFSLDEDKKSVPIQGFDVSHDLIITVTDPFGRVSVAEYHQQKQSSIVFTVNGNTVTENNIIYVGDQRGVNFSYLRTAYNVTIYDAGTGNALTNLQPLIINDMVCHTFTPKQGSTTIQQYRIVAIGRVSGAVLFDKVFVFDTRLPDVEWKNASGHAIDVEGQTFVSDVCFDISNSLVPMSFPVTISYTRTYNNVTEYVALKSGTEEFTFKQPGKYTVTFCNTVWAEKNYNFEIEQVDDNVILVYDDGKQLSASPSDYEFINESGESVNIPRYVFTTNDEGGSITDYEVHGLKVEPGNTNRELAGNQELGTDYYYYDHGYNTLVWRFAFCLGESDGVKVYASPIYFATTGVVVSKLNVGSSGSAISLMLNGNPDIKGGVTNFLITPSQTTYHIIDDTFMQLHDKKVEVRLSCDESIIRDDNDLPCFMEKGNVIKVDCYYNGTLVKTLIGDGKDQVFTISHYSAGYYEFEVHDLVGNSLEFGNSDNPNDLNHRQKRYMLVVMTKPMVLINDKQPVNGMIYNDEVELKLINYGNQFWAKVHADKVAEDNSYFEKYFCITKIEGTYTGSKGKEDILINADGKQTSFNWKNSGSYRINVTYRINENIFDNLEAEYHFQIIPAKTVREKLSMPIYPDVQIASVTRNGYQIHDFDNLKVNDTLEFNADVNPGNYVITLKTYDSLLQEFISHEVSFNIQHKANSASDYFVLSSGSGLATTGDVTLYYNPYWLFKSQGKVTIYLYKDYEEDRRVEVDKSSTEGNSSYNTQALFTVSESGLYKVVVRDADGDPVYMSSWTIVAEESSFGYIILAIVCGLVGVGVLIVLRMRSKMSTK